MVSHFFSVSFSVLIAVASLKYQTVTGQAAGLTDNFLLMTDSTLNNIYELSMETGQAFRLFSSRPIGTNPIAVTYDPINKVIYWSDVGDSYRTISKFSLITLTNSTVYVDNTLTAIFDGLTIDPYEQILYYTDAGNNRVGQMSTSGTGHRIISAIVNSQPRAIIHDKQNSLLYWTDWSSTSPAIYRAPTSTGITTTLVSGNLYWPNALAIDFYNGVMYWGDSGLHKIEMANIDGTGRTVLVQSTTARYYGMTLDSLYLYYTDWTLSYVVKMNRQTYVSSVVASTVSFGRLNAIVQYNSTDRNTIGNFNLTSTASPTLPLSSATTTTTTTTTTTKTPVGNAGSASRLTDSSTPDRTTSTTTSAAPTYSYTELTTTKSLPLSQQVSDNNNSNQSPQAQQLTTIIVAVVVSCAGVLIVIAVVVGCVMVCRRRPAPPVPKPQQDIYNVPEPTPPPPYNEYEPPNRYGNPNIVVDDNHTYYSIIQNQPTNDDNEMYLTVN